MFVFASVEALGTAASRRAALGTAASRRADMTRLGKQLLRSGGSCSSSVAGMGKAVVAILVGGYSRSPRGRGSIANDNC